MAEPNVSGFINALHELEDDRKLGPLLKLFDPDAELGNPHIQLGPGNDAVARFWRSYRANFDEIHSEFRQVACNGDTALLEWTSRGELQFGHEFEYRGVSVLEFEGGRIKRFRAYFDPTELGHQIEPDIREREVEAATHTLH
jgi:ketosteroid isomerase-like protein